MQMSDLTKGVKKCRYAGGGGGGHPYINICMFMFTYK